MEKYIPYEKLSKKKQKELNAQKRNMGQPESGDETSRKPEGIQPSKDTEME